MKIPTLVILFCGLCTQVSAQNKIIGFVTEQNSGKKRVDLVIVRSAGASAVTSSNKGDFILKFQDVAEGESVVIRPEKEGWELVNEKEMTTLIPKNPEKNLFKIVLCRLGVLAKAKKEYYNISDEYLLKQFNAKLAALNKEKADYGEERKKLIEQRDVLQKQLNEIADEYSRINLDDATEIERKAIELFKEGKIDESIKLRESLHSGEEIKKAIKQKAAADSAITLHTRNLQRLAQEYILKFDFKAAERAYEELVLADTTNFDNTFDFAYFLSDQNQIDKALKYSQIALRLAKTESEKADTYINLGGLFQVKNDYANALNYYQTALSKYEKLEKINPDIYELDVAKIKNNLGVLYKELNDYPNSLNAFQFAVVIYEKLAKNHPEIYDSDMAKIQNNLGSLYQYINDNPSALNAYKFALTTYEKLAKINPNSYESEVALTHNNLGGLYLSEHDYPNAINAYKTSLLIREKLAKINPDIYEPDMATTEDNLGILYHKINDYTNSLNAYHIALQIREKFAKINPETYEPDVAITQNNLGTLYQEINDYPKALKSYQTALLIREKLAKNNPDTYNPKVAMTQNNLGGLYRINKDYPNALNAYQTALDIYERVAKINPETYEPKVGMTQYNLGILYQDIQDYPKSLNAYQTALLIYERLAKINPNSFESDVASTQNNLGSLYVDFNDYPNAVKTYQATLIIYEKLAKVSPDVYESDLASVQTNLGILYQETHDYPNAHKAYQSAIQIYEKLAKINPKVYEIEFCYNVSLFGLLQKKDYQENLLVEVDDYIHKAKPILTKYKDIFFAQTLAEDLEVIEKFIKIVTEVNNSKNQINYATKFLEKIQIQQKILTLYDSLIQADYVKFIEDFASGLGNLAWYQLFEKQFTEAETSAREALKPTKYKKTEDYDTKVEWINTNLALALLFQGKYAEAEKIYLNLNDKIYDNATYTEIFLKDLDDLKKAGITHPDIPKIRTLLKNK